MRRPAWWAGRYAIAFKPLSKPLSGNGINHTRSIRMSIRAGALSQGAIRSADPGEVSMREPRVLPRPRFRSTHTPGAFRLPRLPM